MATDVIMSEGRLITRDGTPVVAGGGDPVGTAASAVAAHAGEFGLGHHLPSGATAGQVLTAGANGTVAWETPASTATLASSMLALAVFDENVGDTGEYIWSGGAAPSEGFTNVWFMGPTDPYTTDGVGFGRDVTWDAWTDTST
jgi:hypothetical protein